EYFGLKDLSDLPTLEDFQEELLGESDPTPQAEFSFGPGEGAGTADPEAPGEPGPAAEEAPGNGTGESNGDEPETEPRASLKEDEADAPGRR
ncbi:MAG: hypothetical protein GWM98_20240, partial [Nitrospinaceae bacterium]|nr:hypothetical protein [Nitrospinaceae bacterium]NIR56381.1 hypothetical protein [Nitrospinaceae bacterium]NIS86843.1 hypothetical protein [Nitrospinaceae bacterium]NIT83679.1 hypothetical protein [Nitrospinaceae bacterium]NIU45877.1 hypothetical protein [Nitrospinaceae bacterium]